MPGPGRPLESAMMLGLRVDVDTLTGTRQGVPVLCRLFHRHGIRASFFFSVGPDNMGRHIWRLLRPAFLIKMMRTKAASLYGWDILLRGTLWPGPNIGVKGAAMIRAACEDGHEIGLHAWDHHAWQTYLDTMDRYAIRRVLHKGYERLTGITGQPPTCSAAPAWKCTPVVLEEKERYPFTYNSDCRGQSVFFPEIHGRTLPQPQVPVTLPTYDEVIGRDGVSNENFNAYLLSLMRPEELNVLTIHAEVEGGICRDLFSDFLDAALARGVTFVPLGTFRETDPIDSGYLGRTEIVGREGWVACQSEVSA